MEFTLSIINFNDCFNFHCKSSPNITYRVKNKREIQKEKMKEKKKFKLNKILIKNKSLNFIKYANMLLQIYLLFPLFYKKGII